MQTERPNYLDQPAAVQDDWAGMNNHAVVSAASPSFWHDAAHSAQMRLVRDYLISPLDNHLPVFEPLKNIIQKAAEPLERLNQMAIQYPELCQVDRNVINAPLADVLLTPEGRKEFCQAAAHNIKSISMPKTGTSEILLKTVGAVNIGSFGARLAKGLIWSGGTRLFLMLCLPWTIGKKVADAYQSQGWQGGLKTLGLETLKGIVSWEAATFGAMLGPMLLPVASMEIPAAIVGMSLLGTAVRHVLNKII